MRFGSGVLLALGVCLSGVARAEQGLPGRAIPDPRYQLRVVTDQSGTLEPPPGGFPQAGARVRAGQVLAYLRPNIPEPERRDLDVQLATARRDVLLGELQVRRYNVNTADQFDGQLPLPSLQILGDYRSAQVRQAQLEAALQGRVALVAEADAVLLASQARNALAVSAGSAVFELGGAAVIELLSADAALNVAALSQAERLTGERIALRPLSDSFDSTLRARRLLFAVESGTALAVGEPVTLLIRSTP